jgi:hypothetical protein
LTAKFLHTEKSRLTTAAVNAVAACIAQRFEQGAGPPRSGYAERRIGGATAGGLRQSKAIVAKVAQLHPARTDL